MLSAERVKLNSDGIVAVEQPLIRVRQATRLIRQKVPFEQLRKAFKTSQKYAEKDSAALATTVQDFVKKALNNEIGEPDKEKALDGLIMRVQNLKRKVAFLELNVKLQESKREEALFIRRSRSRINHLMEISDVQTIDSPEFLRWNEVRLNRSLVDYMLRNGQVSTAELLAEQCGIKDLVDVELFVQTQKIEDALKRKNCTEGLQWCSDNKSGLRKMKSTLEFNLRFQEYVELIRNGRIVDGLAYVKKHLTSWSETHMKEIQRAMALLAFPPTTTVEPYKITMQVGLCALRTHFCNTAEDRNINCPVCDSGTFGKIAKSLPNAHHVNSCLVCRISGEIMDENNPPMVLPNGYVYSSKALERMAAEKGGRIECPRTGLICDISEARKMFIT